MQRKKPKITLIPTFSLLKASRRSFALTNPTLCFTLCLALCFAFNLLINNNSTYAAQPTVSLSVATPELSTTVAPGEIGYLSSNVTYSVSNAESYALKVSYTNQSTGLANGDQVIPGVGTNGMTGTSMKTTDANAWGYSWTSSSNTNLDNLTYYTMPAYNNNLTGTDLASGYLDGGTGDKASITQKIVFAAKFASDNVYNGTYHTSVMLSLAASPKVVTRKWSNDVDSGIAYMQDMTPEVCANSQVPTPTSINTVPTLILDDIRGGGYENSDGDGTYPNSYIIAKLGDGNCWMMQNMKLDLDTAYALTPDNSDIRDPWPTNFALDTLKSTVSWTNDTARPYYRNNPNSLTFSDGSGPYQDKYGYYYNWCAATAGTCVDSGETASSICPKGWELPTLNKLNSIQSGSWTTAGVNGLSGAPGRYFGYGFFPAAGYVNNGSLNDVSSGGRYWSSTASNTNAAYDLYFDSRNAGPSGNGYRHFGYSVRCVAPAS